MYFYSELTDEMADVTGCSTFPVVRTELQFINGNMMSKGPINVSIYLFSSSWKDVLWSMYDYCTIDLSDNRSMTI